MNQAEPDSELTGALRTLSMVSTGTLTTQLLARGLAHTFLSGVHPLNPTAARFAGVAYTLRLIPMREDKMSLDAVKSPAYPQRLAIEECPPGGVLVIDARGVRGTGTLGDILVTRLKARGAAAVVTDGDMRDTVAMKALNFPVFCAGAAARNSHINHFASEVQVPIACGGAAVFPDDVLVGDEDGVVVFPAELASELAAAGAEQELLETFIQERIAAGASVAGTYPPNDETRAEFEDWRRKQ